MREMDANAFWKLIDAAKAECGQDMERTTQWLKEQLMALGPRQAQDFHDIMHGYQDLAYQYGLWSAASILCEGCTDDGFIDFRAWLIGQGKEVYLAALRDPDSLAEVEAYGGCQWEEMSHVGYRALKELTGQNACDCTDRAAYDALTEVLNADITYGEGIGYPYELNELEAYFPRLCAKYLEPDELKFMAETLETIWDHSAARIQKARECGPPAKDTPQINLEMGGM